MPGGALIKLSLQNTSQKPDKKRFCPDDQGHPDILLL